MRNKEFWSEEGHVINYLNCINGQSIFSVPNFLYNATKHVLPKDFYPEDSLVVDVGSGPANASNLFIERYGFKKLLAIDFSPAMFNLLPLYVDTEKVKVQTQQADVGVERFDADDKTASLVVCCSCMNYVPSVENIFNE